VQFQFNFEKTLQAAAVLMTLDGDRMESIRLLKLLYIADREILAETGVPITGDNAVALKHGPVLNHVYGLIRGQATRAGEWADTLRTVNHNVELRKPIGRGKLNRAEVDKLQEITDRYRNDNVWEICDQTHDFPEWKDNYVPNQQTPIPWEQALEAQGRGSLIPAVEREEGLRRHLDTLFGS